MQTIGKYLKGSRLSRKLSIADVERETRIKKEFIKSIEDEAWGSLPEFPIVLGFVKNLASFLKINRTRALALLRRDYPPTSQTAAVRVPEVKEWKWSPRLTFTIGVILIAFVTIGYLSFQYIGFTSSPTLQISTPRENQDIYEPKLLVVGKTDSGATVRVNNQPALIDESGEFMSEIEISADTKYIDVKAISRSGKETVIHRTINPKF